MGKREEDTTNRKKKVRLAKKRCITSKKGGTNNSSLKIRLNTKTENKLKKIKKIFVNIIILLSNI